MTRRDKRRITQAARLGHGLADPEEARLAVAIAVKERRRLAHTAIVWKVLGVLAIVGIVAGFAMADAPLVVTGVVLLGWAVGAHVRLLPLKEKLYVRTIEINDRCDV
jgi:hypothetical protein